MLEHSPYRYLSRFYTMLAALLYAFLILFHILYPFLSLTLYLFHSTPSYRIGRSLYLRFSFTFMHDLSLLFFGPLLEYSIAPLKSYLSSPFFVLRFVLYLYVLLRPPACI